MHVDLCDANFYVPLPYNTHIFLRLCLWLMACGIRMMSFWDNLLLCPLIKEQGIWDVSTIVTHTMGLGHMVKSDYTFDWYVAELH